jgi:hypothetical protein
VSDEDVRALFRRVDDGPPLSIDMHEVMARGRRVRTRRRTLAVAGSTFAVVAAAVLVGLSTGGEVESPDIVRPAEPTSVSDTSTPSAPPPQQGPPGQQPQPNPPGSTSEPDVPGATAPRSGTPAPPAAGPG